MEIVKSEEIIVHQFLAISVVFSLHEEEGPSGDDMFGCTSNKGIGDAGSTEDFSMLWSRPWSAMVCLGLLG